MITIMKLNYPTINFINIDRNTEIDETNLIKKDAILIIEILMFSNYIVKYGIFNVQRDRGSEDIIANSRVKSR